MTRAALLRAAALAAVLALAGCAAPVPAPVRPAAPPPAATGAPAAPAPGAPATARPDSAPSPAALAVLATIPEPLGGAAAPVGMPAPVEAYDTLRTQVPATDVPVPAPTAPMQAPVVRPEVLPPAEPPPPPPPAPAAAPGDTCWRVQIAAPSERDKGKTIRDAAESLLMVPMIVDREGGRFKVRSRDCLSREAAGALRARALDSGFKGAFLVTLPVAPR